jgi:hypothetical protein
MSKKLSAQEYVEIRSEDPSQLLENTGMDISPSSTWKTPDKNDAGTVDKNDDDVADALQNLSLSEQNKKMKVENKELAEKIVSSGAGGSDDKYGNETY